MFGQQKPSGFGQPPFGQTPTTSTGVFGQTTSGSIFGQSSGFGANPPPYPGTGTSSSGQGAVSQGFGLQSSSATSGFGQSASFSSGLSQTSSGGSSVFGSTFGQTSSGFTPLFGQTSSGVTPTANTSIGATSGFSQTSSGFSSGFGQANSGSSQTSSSGSGVSLFGVQKKQTVPSQSSGLFGKSAASSGGFESKPLFSSAGDAAKVSSASGGGLFGKKTPDTSGFGDGQPSQTFGDFSQGKPGQFGKPATTTASAGGNTGLFGKPGITTSSVFGTRKVTKSASTPSANKEPAIQEPQVKVLFGKTPSENSSWSTRTAENKAWSTRTSENTSWSSRTSGSDNQKHVLQKQQMGSKGLFGKPPQEEVAGASGAGSSPQKRGLFGKPLEKEDKQSFGSEAQEEGEEEPVKRKLIRRVLTDKPAFGAAGGLFGKALSGVKKDAPTRKRSLGDSGGKDGGTEPKDEARPASRLAFRRQSSVTEEFSSKVALICKNVPPALNNKIFLRKHFEKYGKVAKVFPNQARNMATIHFQDHDGAALAKKRGRELKRGMEMEIFWSKYTPTKSPLQVAKSKRSAQSTSGDLDDELASMSGTSDIAGERMTLLDRPEERRARTHSGEKKLEKRSRSPSEVNVKRARSMSPAPRSTSPAPPIREQPASSGFTSPVKAQVSKTTPAALRTLVNAIGQTATERLEILETRDKLLRQGRKKQTDLSKAQAVTGTCPDMCPEKERYIREERRRLHHYEILPGTDHKVDHARAVKEYSRASADQEEPLPHEIRPPVVLEKTMYYILHNIMDQGRDGRWGEWYDFLWDRTRGMRKDITQQHLCEPIAVSLLEKCTRFHIYAAERLCEEDMMNFDEKINNENLTKCLQSLKEMYYDLSSKKGIYCPREAEFRSYMVLMNLNEGDTLREVQQHRDEIRLDPQIKFALQVYSALNSNNYVKFFKLVNKANFLSACIMHRYFNQVRRAALSTMLSAYVAKKKSQYPLEELVRQLQFEDAAEAKEFCNHYGLMVIDDGLVVLDRSAFITPETAFVHRRAVSLIESKLNVSVGETVNGGPLPPPELIQPSTSFDDRGKYIGESVTMPTEVETLAAGDSQGATLKETVPVVPVQAQAAKVCSNESIKEVAKQLFLEVIQEMSVEVSTGLYKAVHQYLDYANVFEPELEAEVTTELTREVCSEVYQEEVKRQREEEERRRCEQEAAEKAARKERVMEELKEEIIGEMVNQEAKALATIEVREIHAKLKVERIQRSTEAVQLELLEEVLAEQVKEVSDDVFQTDVTDRLQLLAEKQKCVEAMRCARFFQRWQNTYAGRLRLKRSMHNYPSAPSRFTVREQLNILMPERSQEAVKDLSLMRLGRHSQLSLEINPEIEYQQWQLRYKMALQSLMLKLRRESAWAALDLAGLVGPRIARKCKQDRIYREVPHLYWKVLLALPEGNGTEDMCSWLKVKLSKGQLPPGKQGAYKKSELLSLYTSEFPGVPVPLGICARSVEGVLPTESFTDSEEGGPYLGTRALIFVLQPLHAGQSDHNYWLEAQARLSRILESKPISPSLPLLVLTFTEHGQDSYVLSDLYRSDKLNLDIMISQELISHVQLVCLGSNSEDPSATNKLSNCIKWLADHSDPYPDLTSRPIRDYIEDFLAAEYFTPVYQNLAERKRHGLLHQSPEALIALFNSAVTHLIKAAASKKLQQFSWPVTEFAETHLDLPRVDWNSEDHLDFLQELLSTLTLPEFDHSNLNSEAWDVACEDVWSYVETVANTGVGDATSLYSRIRLILKKAQQDFDELCFFTQDLLHCKPCYVNMPWTDVIVACINHQLLLLDYIDQESRDGEEELIIHYIAEELENFRQPLEWRESIRAQNQNDTARLDATVTRAVTKHHDESSDSDSDEEDDTDRPESSSPKRAKIDRSIAYIDLDCMTPEIVAASDSAYMLKKNIASEKKEALEFEQKLKKLMEDGEDMTNQSFSYMEAFFHSPTTPGVGQSLTKTTGVTSFAKTPSVNAGSFSKILTNSSETRMYTDTPKRFETRIDNGHSSLNDLELENDTDGNFNFKMRPSLSESIVQLKQDLISDKKASELYEMKLQAIMNG